MNHITPPRLVGNLYSEVTSFVGRRQEAAEVKRLLSTARLVTLTGVGGVGKTRLALRVAAEIAPEFRDGVWFVDLAPLDDDGLLTQAVASALNLQAPVRAEWPLSVIAKHLKDKDLLLILDNCEHVRDACAVLVDALLRQAPNLHVLATSRQTLGLTGEHVFPVPTLSLPDDLGDVRLDSVAHYEALSLFVARAQAVRPGLELTEANVADVASVCRRLDGIPLAIELAAARVSVLSVHELLQRLEDRFALLSVGSSAAVPRHQTLRELVGWSWDLCSPSERLLWSRMSIFPSDFELQAVESVCAGGDLNGSLVLDLLTSLAEKTVVGVYEHDGQSRYRMLDTLRQYGHERLVDTGEFEAIRMKHWAYYSRMVDSASDDSFSARQRNWLERLRTEHNNIRAALETSFVGASLVGDGLDMVSDLWLFWIATGRTTEARRWLDRGLRMNSLAMPVRIRALETCAYLCVMQGDLTAARAMLAEVGDAVERDPHLTHLSRATQLEALAILSEGNLSQAEPLLTAAVQTQPDGTNLLGFMDAYFCLAALKALQGDLDRAEALCLEALRYCDQYRETWSKSYMLWCLGFVYLQRGDLESANAHGREALRLGQSLGEPWAIACCLELLAWSAVAGDEPTSAAHLMGAAERIWGKTGVALLGIRGLTDHHDRFVRALQDALGDDELSAAMAEGAAMKLDEAVARGLGRTLDATPPVQRPPARLLPELTKRENEVAALIAQGLTNRSIAARLMVSPRTAEGHVERILNKLGFTSRTQVAAWFAAHRGQ